MNFTYLLFLAHLKIRDAERGFQSLSQKTRMPWLRATSRTAIKHHPSKVKSRGMHRTKINVLLAYRYGTMNYSEPVGCDRSTYSSERISTYRSMRTNFNNQKARCRSPNEYYNYTIYYVNSIFRLITECPIDWPETLYSCLIK